MKSQHSHLLLLHSSGLQPANLNTTTMGLSLPVMTIRLLHSINALNTIIPRLRTWKANCNNE